MKRTICLKLTLSLDQPQWIFETQSSFSRACNSIVPFVKEKRCWNSVSLHQLCYYAIRKEYPELGSQMVCNAIRKVCSAYKAQRVRKNDPVPDIGFKPSTSIHLDKRTYSIKGNALSLFTIHGRVRCTFQTGDFQLEYLKTGLPKEAELIHRKGHWFFNLVVELPEIQLQTGGRVMAVDLGENNLAVTSNGKIYGGKELRHQRDKFLARRGKLQSNGSRSAKRTLKRISGKERRCVQETNHTISKQIVKEAQENSVTTLAMEDLTNIRKRIRGNTRMRSRLHRWAFSQLQTFVEYKARAMGMFVVYLNPAYTSLTCSCCARMGVRHKHSFFCSTCGSQQHADMNACRNLCRLALSADSATASVNMPMVAAERLATSLRL